MFEQDRHVCDWVDDAPNVPGLNEIAAMESALELADDLAKAVEGYCAADGDDFGEHAHWPEWKAMFAALAEYRKARGTSPEPILSDLGT